MIGKRRSEGKRRMLTDTKGKKERGAVKLRKSILVHNILIILDERRAIIIIIFLARSSQQVVLVRRRERE
jgi:hypothetical protein